MTAHELARKLLAGPDVLVVCYEAYDGMILQPVTEVVVNPDPEDSVVIDPDLNLRNPSREVVVVS